MASDPNGWPDKPGVPLNPEQDSERHVIMLDGVIEVYCWDARRGLFLDKSGRWLAPYDLLPPDDAYLGRSYTPAEVAARVVEARAKALEEAAGVASKGEADTKDVSENPAYDKDTRHTFYTMGRACKEIAAAIRALKEKNT